MTVLQLPKIWKSILIASTMKGNHLLWKKCSSGRFKKGFRKEDPDGSVWIDN
jgi:hypothetical protein